MAQITTGRFSVNPVAPEPQDQFEGTPFLGDSVTPDEEPQQQSQKSGAFGRFAGWLRRSCCCKVNEEDREDDGSKVSESPRTTSPLTMPNTEDEETVDSNSSGPTAPHVSAKQNERVLKQMESIIEESSPEPTPDSSLLGVPLGSGSSPSPVHSKLEMLKSEHADSRGSTPQESSEVDLPSMPSSGQNTPSEGEDRNF